MRWLSGVLAGLLAFLVSSVGASLLFPPGLLVTFIPGVVGSLLLLLGLGYRDQLIKRVLLSMLALVVSFLTGFAIGELSSILPVGDQVPNIVFFIVTTTFFGTGLGLIVYGVAPFRFFFITSLLAGMIFTALLELLNLMQGLFWNGVDLNFVVIMSTLGAVAGFVLGLYRDRNHV